MSIHFAGDPESVPLDLPERELAWHLAMHRGDYVRAAKLARSPLPRETSARDKRKWYVRKFQMRGIAVGEGPGRVRDRAVGAPELGLGAAEAVQA